jgi:hypothetical protein
MATEVLRAFEETSFTYNGETKTVWRAGSGPGIVVMSEMPGITPAAISLLLIHLKRHEAAASSPVHAAQGR